MTTPWKQSGSGRALPPSSEGREQDFNGTQAAFAICSSCASVSTGAISAASTSTTVRPL
jgi:hypothetical protein